MTRDNDVARDLARAAGELLLRVRAEDVSGDVSDLRDRGDRQSHDLLTRLLAECCPDDAVLSEENADNSTLVTANRLWIIDPLDGTREFAEGRADWAVHVALRVDDALTAAAVALPAEDRVYVTGMSGPVVGPAERSVRLAVSRTRPGPVSAALAERLGGELVPMGSAGVKAMAVLTGEVDAYVHSGGQYVWDSAAPVAVASRAGLHTSRLDGSPLSYSGDTTWLPDLIVCRAELAATLLRTIAEIDR